MHAGSFGTTGLLMGASDWPPWLAESLCSGRHEDAESIAAPKVPHDTSCALHFIYSLPVAAQHDFIPLSQHPSQFSQRAAKVPWMGAEQIPAPTPHTRPHLPCLMIWV